MYALLVNRLKKRESYYWQFSSRGVKARIQVYLLSTQLLDNSRNPQFFSGLAQLRMSVIIGRARKLSVKTGGDFVHKKMGWTCQSSKIYQFVSPELMFI